MAAGFYIAEKCIYDEFVHGSMGLPETEGYLNAVFCPKKNGECGRGEWIPLVFAYYIHPEMLWQNRMADKYIEEVNGFSVFDYKYGMRKLLPNNDEVYCLTCRHGEGHQYYAFTMSGGVYKDRVRYRVHYPSLFKRNDFHSINNQINSFIESSVRYEG